MFRGRGHESHCATRRFYATIDARRLCATSHNQCALSHIVKMSGIASGEECRSHAHNPCVQAIRGETMISQNNNAALRLSQTRAQEYRGVTLYRFVLTRASKGGTRWLRTTESCIRATLRRRRTRCYQPFRSRNTRADARPRYQLLKLGCLDYGLGTHYRLPSPW